MTFYQTWGKEGETKQVLSGEVSTSGRQGRMRPVETIPGMRGEEGIGE
jgi:hypothetical protein